MSHFTVLVLGDNHDALLEPFSENLEVEEYETECYCIGYQARNAAAKKTDKKFGTIDDAREKFKTTYPEDQQNQNTWTEFIAERQSFYAEENKKHKLAGKPDPKCEDCNGTGKRKTTCNPDAKWDWYTVGGRWSGYFPIKQDRINLYRGVDKVDAAAKSDVDLDIAVFQQFEYAMQDYNREITHLLSANRSTKPMRYRCTVCGTPIEEDNCPKCGDAYKGRRPNYGLLATYALLTSEGEWVQKGEMGWFGMSNDEHDEHSWEDIFDKIINEAGDDVKMTLVDCHI